MERNYVIVSLCITVPLIWQWYVVMSISVCLSVCLSVCEHISRTTRRIATKFVVHVSFSMAVSFSGSVEVPNVLTVLWMRAMWRQVDTIAASDVIVFESAETKS